MGFDERCATDGEPVETQAFTKWPVVGCGVPELPMCQVACLAIAANDSCWRRELAHAPMGVGMRSGEQVLGRGCTHDVRSQGRMVSQLSWVFGMMMIQSRWARRLRKFATVLCLGLQHLRGSWVEKHGFVGRAGHLQAAPGAGSPSHIGHVAAACGR